jgi:hypothetical protein
MTDFFLRSTCVYVRISSLTSYMFLGAENVQIKINAYKVYRFVTSLASLHTRDAICEPIV